MTQEEKQLLLQDLCVRLPYEVMGINSGRPETIVNISILGYYKNKSRDGWHHIEDFKPYLRPMSSMTEEEYKEYDKETDIDVKDSAETLKANLKAKSRVRISKWYHGTDWLNANHFDYRGLIEKGLALEAPEGMYKTE